MKQAYLRPNIKTLMATTDCPLTGSLTGNIDGSDGLGYGGVDTGGKKDPEAKQYLPDEFHNVWDH